MRNGKCLDPTVIRRMNSQSDSSTVQLWYVCDINLNLVIHKLLYMT